MPVTTKRRKVAALERSSRGNGPLANFTTVSKATTTVKVVLEKNHRVDTFVLTPTKEQTLNPRKRKAIDEDDEDAPEDSRPKSLQTKTRTQSPHTPIRRTSKASSTTHSSTPGTETRNLLKGLLLETNSARLPSSNSLTFSSSVDASTPKSASKLQKSLPTELFDLINLHTAFLTTLSIHYAHNGVNVPVDVRILIQDVSHAWGKRKVTVEDICILLGIWNTAKISYVRKREIPKLSLEDYGGGKICLEIHTTEELATMAQPINEDVMNHLFALNVDELWTAAASHSTAEFLKSLPRQQIMTNSSLAKISPMLLKGQRRLEDFKAGLAARVEEKQQKFEEKASTPKISLLDRLRAKQLQQSLLAPGLTKEQIARRGALARAEDIVAFLTILSTSGSVGQSRVSFTLSTVLTKLRDSSRTPISMQEGEACLRLLAAEVAPEWLRFAKMGTVEILLVNREAKLSQVTIKERVKGLQSMKQA